MSPTMPILSPSSDPKCWRIVRESRSACVGCWWAPSPPLRTGCSIHSAMRHGAPVDWCRTTMASVPIALMVSTVSLRLSPFLSEEVPGENDIVSALRALAAFSNDIFVRVDASKNMVATVLPRRAGTLGIGRWRTSTNSSASSSSPRGLPWRVLRSSGSDSCGLPRLDGHGVFAVAFDQVNGDPLALRRWNVLADVVGSDREFPVATVDESGQLDPSGRPRSASASRAARIVLPVYSTSSTRTTVLPPSGTGNVRGSERALRPAVQVVAIHADVEASAGDRFAFDLLDHGCEPLGEGTPRV